MKGWTTRMGCYPFRQLISKNHGGRSLAAPFCPVRRPRVESLEVPPSHEKYDREYHSGTHLVFLTKRVLKTTPPHEEPATPCPPAQLIPVAVYSSHVIGRFQHHHHGDMPGLWYFGGVRLTLEDWRNNFGRNKLLGLIRRHTATCNQPVDELSYSPTSTFPKPPPSRHPMRGRPPRSQTTPRADQCLLFPDRGRSTHLFPARHNPDPTSLPLMGRNISQTLNLRSITSKHLSFPFDHRTVMQQNIFSSPSDPLEYR